jgi:hypothetical protein
MRAVDLVEVGFIMSPAHPKGDDEGIGDLAGGVSPIEAVDGDGGNGFGHLSVSLAATCGGVCGESMR